MEYPYNYFNAAKENGNPFVWGFNSDLDGAIRQMEAMNKHGNKTWVIDADGNVVAGEAS